MTNLQFMETLKPGDSFEYVAYYRYNNMRRLVTMTVVKFTKTQIVCKSGKQEVRFRLSNGSMVGDSYVRFPLPADPLTVEQVKSEERKRELVGFLSDAGWFKLDLPTLEHVASIVVGASK